VTGCRVVFIPAGKEGRVEVGTTVLDAARALGVDLDSVCGGRALCGHCQVHPTTGHFAKWAIDASDDALAPIGPTERDARLARPRADGARLGCTAAVLADAVIDVPAASQVHRPVVRKEVVLDDLVVDPVVALAYVELPPADGTSVVGQLRAGLREQHGITIAGVDAAVLRDLHAAIAGEARSATVALRRGATSDDLTVGAIHPGFTDVACGIAVDVGSTTIAGHLCDLSTGEVLASAGVMNPQIRFGEDLMSRVSYVMMNPGGAATLTGAVRDALNALGTDLCRAGGVEASRVLDVVIVGNPIMHHLVLGLDPTPLGTAPFELATDEAVETRADALGMGLRNAHVHLLPCIAGHVGADTAAAMLSEGPHRAEWPQLLVDIGTNAEIVLGDRTAVFAASSPTGPAFEGAQISCGQRATAGAIERVRIDRATLTPSVRVIGADGWSDEPGFAASAPAVTGVCGSGIVSAIAELYLAGVIDADGTIVGTIVGDTAVSSPRVVADGRTFAYVLYDHGTTRLTITQNDVRAIQLAKAALRAGIDLLVEHSGFTDLPDIRLAGAFGAHIDPVDAMVLGLIPDAPRSAVRAVGNAAGAGAVRALVSAAQRAEIAAVVRRVTKIETATEPRFQELFVAAMAFPHATAPTPHLAAQVDLPVRRAPSPGGRRRHRTRRQP
jgi:uncharacterized 2Fe-2S/4Fe-4S cluster protein (DUF4445 family)